MAKLLYQNSNQVFSVTVYDTDGTTPVSAATFSGAEWRLFAAGSCTPIITKSLSAGITVVSTDFAVTLADTDITVFGTDGEYTHQFRAVSASSDVPIFDEPVDIVETCPA